MLAYYLLISALICTAIMAFNKGRLPSMTNDNPDYEDYMSGHPKVKRVVSSFKYLYVYTVHRSLTFSFSTCSSSSIQPMRRYPSNSTQNLPMVRAIEKTQNGFSYAEGKPSLGHMFMVSALMFNTASIIMLLFLCT